MEGHHERNDFHHKRAIGQEAMPIECKREAGIYVVQDGIVCQEGDDAHVPGGTLRQPDSLQDCSTSSLTNTQYQDHGYSPENYFGSRTSSIPVKTKPNITCVDSDKNSLPCVKKEPDTIYLDSQSTNFVCVKQESVSSHSDAGLEPTAALEQDPAALCAASLTEHSRIAKKSDRTTRSDSNNFVPHNQRVQSLEVSSVVGNGNFSSSVLGAGKLLLPEPVLGRHPLELVECSMSLPHVRSSAVPLDSEGNRLRVFSSSSASAASDCLKSNGLKSNGCFQESSEELVPSLKSSQLVDSSVSRSIYSSSQKSLQAPGISFTHLNLSTDVSSNIGPVSPDSRKRFHCSDCGYSTAYKQCLLLHQASKHSDERPFACPDCPYATARKQLLKYHMASRHSETRPLTCDLCDFSTVTKYNFKLHLMTKHVGDKPFKCDLCDYSTARRYHLKDHRITNHGLGDPIKCEFCDFATARRSSLKTHYNSKHNSEKRFMCDFCNYSTSRIHSFQRHQVTIHSSEKPFRCELCQYSCARKECLKDHMESRHSSVKPFKCEMCDYSSSRKQTLKTHVTNKHSTTG